MSYTSFSIGRPGRAYDGVAMGSEEWNALITRQFEILGEGIAPESGFINIGNYIFLPVEQGQLETGHVPAHQR